MSRVRVNINGRELTGQSDQTILDIASENNIHIPTLCFSGHLEIYASCGLCLVEVEGAPRLLRACATLAADGMVIQTENHKIRKARKLALELILSDHRGDCRAPCVLACPANCDAQGYAALVANGQYKEALKLVKEFMPLPASIGRVCPAPCEENCRRNLMEGAVSIRYFKRFIADLDLADEEPYLPEVGAETGKKVAVIGSGPAGLTAAYFLRRSGHLVTVFEALPEMGGMLRYGIPEYRLPKKVLDAEIGLILELGVEARTNLQLGEDFSIDYLFKNGYDAVYLAIGAQSSKRMGVPGEDMGGILGGTEFLRAVMLNEEVKLGDRVAVIGGGNTAMDAARTAKRLGASSVTVVYRRAREQMPAQDIEVIEADEEGVEFRLLAAPVQIEGNGQVEKMVCQQMRLGEPDDSGRRRPEPIPDAFFTLEVDTIIAAIGQDVVIDKLEDDVKVNRYRTIDASEETFLTSAPGVFAGGDGVTGPGIAIEAIAAGKRAAEVINNYLGSGQVNPYKTSYDITQEDLTEEKFAEKERVEKVKMPLVEADVRVKNFREIELGLTPESATSDAQRCLECGCFDVFECKLRSFATEYGAKPERIMGEKHDYDQVFHPFIVRDPNKCILCGLCVRTCSEVIGAEALGLVNRGFDVYVSPSLDLPLEQTACVSCGQCVYVCPTGALVENMSLTKPAPWELKQTRTVCGYCGVGCSMQLETVGETIVRAVPVSGPANEELLCQKGRFGFEYVNGEKRLKAPLIREGDALKETTWNDALIDVTKKAKSLKARFGGESIAVLVGPRYTSEENYLIQKFARGLLGTNNMSSFTEPAEGLSFVLGLGASTNSYTEIAAADFILAAGVDLPDYPIAVLKMKKAAEKGAKLWLLDSRESYLQKSASGYLKVDEKAGLSVIYALLLYAQEKGYANKAFLEEYVENYGQLEELLKQSSMEELLAGSGLSPGDIAACVDGFATAKKPLLVLGSKDLAPEAAGLLAGLNLLLGQLGKPRRGILYLRNRCNSQGMFDLGVNASYLPGYQKVDDAGVRDKFARAWKAPVPAVPGKTLQEILEGVQQGSIKAVFVFGENVDEATAGKLAGADLLVVQDLFLTGLAEKAHVVLPAASFAESTGSFINSERRIQKVRPALKPPAGKENWQVLLELMEQMGYYQQISSPADVWKEVSPLAPIFADVTYAALEENPCWPGNPVLSMEQLLAANGKLAFALPGKEQRVFVQKITTDSAEQWLEGYLKAKGLG